MDGFFNQEPKPHHSVGKFDTDAWEWVETLEIREETPVMFGVILGDVLHNLRSALDHTICQVSLLDSEGADCEASQFPIASKSEAQFEAMATDRIPALNESHRALVKAVQPYHAGDKAGRHPLSILADFSNRDKHRLVNPTYSFFATDGMVEQLEHLLGPDASGVPSPILGYLVAKKGSRMEHGTPWLRLLWRPDEEPPRSVKVSYHLALGISLGEVGLDAEDFPRVAEAVLKIIERFMADFPETVFEDE